jgi:hypothetical protein
MQPAARRQRAYRQRASKGEAVLRVSVHYFGVIDALIASSRLSEADALDRTKVEAALADILCEWARRWRDFRDA